MNTPTKDGWHWFRREDDEEFCPYWLYFYTNSFVCRAKEQLMARSMGHQHPQNVRMMRGEWGEPLAPNGTRAKAERLRDHAYSSLEANIGEAWESAWALAENILDKW